MQTMKHVGKVKNTGSKVLVVFRTLPGESNSALVLGTATLPDMYHNSIMQLVEESTTQDAYELGEVLFTKFFPDGRPMLRALQADGRLQKVATDNIIMTPTSSAEIPLDQLNLIIAEQKNCTVDDLCTFVKGYKKDDAAPKPNVAAEQAAPVDTAVVAQAAVNEVLTDSDIARSYRSQADAMYKEAARLRKEADALDPPKKKAAKSDESVKATESADA